MGLNEIAIVNAGSSHGMKMRGKGVWPWRSGESGDEGEMGLAVESCRIVERGRRDGLGRGGRPRPPATAPQRDFV